MKKTVQCIGMMVVLFLAVAATSQAGTLTWNNGDGNSLWDTNSLNWSGSAWPSSSSGDDDAVFGAAGEGTVSVSNTITANDITVSTNYVFTNGTINLDGATNIISLNKNLSLTIGSALQCSDTLIFDNPDEAPGGDSFLITSDNPDLTGGVIFDALTSIKCATAASLGSGPITIGSSAGCSQVFFGILHDSAVITNDVTIKTVRWAWRDGDDRFGTNLTLNGTVTMAQSGGRDIYIGGSATRQIIINGIIQGTSGLYIKSPGIIALNNPTNSFSGNINLFALNGNDQFRVRSDGSMGDANNILKLGVNGTNPSYFTVSASFTSARAIWLDCDRELILNTETNDLVWNGEIIASATYGGILGKQGTGTLTLGGVNTYDGTTLVHEGTLLINGNSSGVTNTLTVESSGDLGGNGSFGGDIVFEAGSGLGDVLSDDDCTLECDGSVDITSLDIDDCDFTYAQDYIPHGDYILITAAGGITGPAATALGTVGPVSASLLIEGNNLILRTPHQGTMFLIK